MNYWLVYNIEYITYTNSQCPRMICSFMTLTSAPDKTSRSLHQLFHVCLWRRNKTNTQRSFSNTADTKASVPFQELACIYKSSHTCKPGVKSSPTWHTSAHAKQHKSLLYQTLSCLHLPLSQLTPALHKCWEQSRTAANRPIPMSC